MQELVGYEQSMWQGGKYYGDHNYMYLMSREPHDQFAKSHTGGTVGISVTVLLLTEPITYSHLWQVAYRINGKSKTGAVTHPR